MLALSPLQGKVQSAAPYCRPLICIKAAKDGHAVSSSSGLQKGFTMGIFTDWLDRQRDAEYLKSSPQPALSDLGLCRSEASGLADAPSDTRQRMEAMADTYGLDGSDINAERWRAVDMARTCATCACVSQCRRWLRQEQHDVEDAGFCPNADRFRDLAGLPARSVKSALRNSTRVPHHYV